MTPRTATPAPRASAFARFGPLAAVLTAIALVAALASTGRGDEQQVSAGAKQRAQVGSGNDQLPISWAEAEKAGTTERQTWGDKCDTKLGRVTFPSVYAPPCLVARPGVKGGATSQGVTDTEVTVVLYGAADDDLAASLQDQSDPADKVKITREKLVAMLAERFETWGRTIKIVHLKGTGSDETSSRADAVKVATEIKAFASIGGPAQQNAYAEELANRGVLCVGCGLSVPDEVFQKNAPYMWGNLQTAEQFLVNVGDYLIGRLFKKKAEFAGDPEMRKRTRVFGSVNFEADPPVFANTARVIAERGAKVGYKSAIGLTYQLVIPELAEKARAIVTKLKEAKVTTVIFLGDPVMPIYLTKAATDQGYFPEWLITGTVLTDTTTFGRQYDQKQWAHAFGVSSLPVALPKEQREAWRTYEWFYGHEPEAPKTVSVVYDPIRMFMLGIHMAGPNLTPETFRDGLFAYPPSGGTPFAPRISFGEHGYHEAPDYLAVDDMTEIWWDVDAKGEDEQGSTEKTGALRYANGGKRYLPGEMPRTESDAFVEEGSLIQVKSVPAEEAPPEYPSPAGG